MVAVDIVLDELVEVDELVRDRLRLELVVVVESVVELELVSVLV